MTMQFNKLTIERMRWGANEGQIVSELEIEGDTGKMKLILPQSAGQEIMKACADIVAREGEKQAHAFRSEFVDSINGKTIEAGQ